MSKHTENQLHRERWSRIQITGLVLSCILLLYGVRLAYLQLIGGKMDSRDRSVVSRSIIQREKGIILDDGRGRIVDSKGRVLTGKHEDVLVLFPVNRQSLDRKAIRTISAWLNMKEEELVEQWTQAKEPFIASVSKTEKAGTESKKIETPLLLSLSQIKDVQLQKWSGVRILPYAQPYPYRTATPHWIGYTSLLASDEHVKSANNGTTMRTGAAGLEQSFQPLLKSIGAHTYLHYTDALQTPLKGLDVRLSRPHNPYYPLMLHTTADMKLHTAIDGIMREQGVHRGAVVVLDVQTRDIVAMVSLPRYDPQHIEPEHTDWNNQAVTALPPGSVFKLVTAAAAIETGKTSPRETFLCTGEYGRYGLSCWHKEGHGELTLEQAFEQSCNVVFAQLGERLSAVQIQQYADKLGFTGKAGLISSDGLGHKALAHAPQEQEGRVFSYTAGDDQRTGTIDGGVRAQSAIGQRDVRVTPLAAANAIVTLLQHGRTGHPRLVAKATDARGHTLMEFKAEAKGEQMLLPRTTRLLQQWMRGTVEEGTGQQLRNRSWKLAGKSGTAQSEAYGTNKLHSWFVGYGPIYKPRYSVAVVSENEISKASQPHIATSVFGEVMDLLAAYESVDQK
ncbi:penicillin-binding transpeptidase domain-containing protein [Paenibacillus sp. SC116]|uniref:peptidoglycan D,D-transpeptidase FtsI family protein n=1 Tax=Paenibacillus sp. SC116 TaxID=2968986 RepID=UPI00215B14E8|nr:penicillin-binding transpeptidase domain-containing protein [Paenibacillus sp. SC116]MCR8845960.1 penicillin-binding transpeptidase domain-containing protein [Paenibacillus sp. SC116]